MAFLLDANVFIEAKRRHYGMDFCPAFWEWLIEQNGAGHVFSIEKVGDELRAGGDDLTEWTDARGDGFFSRPMSRCSRAWQPLPSGLAARTTARLR